MGNDLDNVICTRFLRPIKTEMADPGNDLENESSNCQMSCSYDDKVTFNGPVSNGGFRKVHLGKTKYNESVNGVGLFADDGSMSDQALSTLNHILNSEEETYDNQIAANALVDMRLPHRKIHQMDNNGPMDPSFDSFSKRYNSIGSSPTENLLVNNANKKLFPNFLNVLSGSTSKRDSNADTYASDGSFLIDGQDEPYSHRMSIDLRESSAQQPYPSPPSANQNGARRNLINPSSLNNKLYKHGMTNPSKNYPCLECPKVFRHPMSLHHHRHVHKGTYTCHTCCKVFSRRWDLHRHLHRSKLGCRRHLSQAELSTTSMDVPPDQHQSNSNISISPGSSSRSIVWNFEEDEGNHVNHLSNPNNNEPSPEVSNKSKDDLTCYGDSFQNITRVVSPASANAALDLVALQETQPYASSLHYSNSSQTLKDFNRSCSSVSNFFTRSSSTSETMEKKSSIEFGNECKDTTSYVKNAADNENFIRECKSTGSNGIDSSGNTNFMKTCTKPRIVFSEYAATSSGSGDYVGATKMNSDGTNVHDLNTTNSGMLKKSVSSFSQSKVGWFKNEQMPANSYASKICLPNEYRNGNPIPEMSSPDYNNVHK